jgi:hypothetical protein
MAGKYDGLKRFLQSTTVEMLTMTFREIEDVVGAKLPASAHGHPEWWTNNAAGHVQGRAWLDAGFETRQVDMQSRKLVFKRVRNLDGDRGGMSEAERAFKHDDAQGLPGRHPMIGAMKGWLTIEEGYDLTQPAMPEWADLLDEKYGPEKAE